MSSISSLETGLGKHLFIGKMNSAFVRLRKKCTNLLFLVFICIIFLSTPLPKKSSFVT